MPDYCALWSLPAALQKVGYLSYLLTPTKVDSHRKPGKLKISASEVLTLYPTMQYNAQTI